jgi:hypothetical protein
MACVLVLSICITSAAEWHKTRAVLRDVSANTADVIIGGIFTYVLAAAPQRQARPVYCAFDCRLICARSILYYTYFTVLRRALDIFSCTESEPGVFTLDADPSVRCWTPGGLHAPLVPWAVASLVAYGAGVPCAIGCVLWRYRGGIRDDQYMWLLGKGGDRESNPNWSVRRRYARLY